MTLIIFKFSLYETIRMSGIEELENESRLRELEEDKFKAEKNNSGKNIKEKYSYSGDFRKKSLPILFLGMQIWGLTLLVFTGYIGDNVIVGANSVVPKDRVIPPNTIWVHGKAIPRVPRHKAEVLHQPIGGPTVVFEKVETTDNDEEEKREGTTIPSNGERF